MSKIEPGYDTFGPQYPQEWDEDLFPCDCCGVKLPGNALYKGDDEQYYCKKCLLIMEIKNDT